MTPNRWNFTTFFAKQNVSLFYARDTGWDVLRVAFFSPTISFWDEEERHTAPQRLHYWKAFWGTILHDVSIGRGNVSIGRGLGVLKGVSEEPGGKQKNAPLSVGLY